MAVKDTSKEVNAEKGEKKEATYSLAKILKAKRYAGKIDVLSALLLPSKKYTFSEVDALLEKFMKKKVR
jgi:hypothetical protein